MRVRFGVCLAVVAVLLGVSPVLASVTNVPADYPSIQQAINAAPTDEHTVINVAAGTYYENLVWDSKSIELIGAGADVTTVDGGGFGTCLTMASVPEFARVEGFTFTHGWARYEAAPGESGGGLFLDRSCATLTHNTITGNSAGYGGGVSLWHSDARLTDNTIAGNSARSGGEASVWNSDATLADNSISGNTALDGGGLNVHYSSPTLTSNTITANSGFAGGGLYVRPNSSPSLTNNTITGNCAHSGGGVCIHGRSSADLRSNTIANNSAPKGGGLWIDSSCGTLADNTIHDNEGAGVAVVADSQAAITGNMISACAPDGVQVFGGANAEVVGNTIVANVEDGVHVASGSVADVSRNDIRASGEEGVDVENARATVASNTVWGCAGWGIACEGAAQATIEANVIERSGLDGVRVAAGASGELNGNTIVASWRAGVRIDRSCGTLAKDTIHDNDAAGVAIVGNSHAAITQCSIYDNGALGIDLGDDGVTPNDEGDLDSGPNDLLNFPEFTQAEVSGGLVTIAGLAAPNAIVEIFGAAPDPTGYGEGKSYLKSVAAGPDGRFSCDVLLSEMPIAATATDGMGNTSAFSAVNMPPVADAGEGQTAEQTSPAGTEMTLGGTGSFDPEGQQLTYEWDLDGDGEYDDAVGPSPTVLLPPGEH